MFVIIRTERNSHTFIVGSCIHTHTCIHIHTLQTDQDMVREGDQSHHTHTQSLTLTAARWRRRWTWTCSHVTPAPPPIVSLRLAEGVGGVSTRSNVQRRRAPYTTISDRCKTESYCHISVFLPAVPLFMTGTKKKTSQQREKHMFT